MSNQSHYGLQPKADPASLPEHASIPHARLTEENHAKRVTPSDSELDSLRTLREQHAAFLLHRQQLYQTYQSTDEKQRWNEWRILQEALKVAITAYTSQLEAHLRRFDKRREQLPSGLFEGLH